MHYHRQWQWAFCVFADTMLSFRISILLTCFSVAIKNANTHGDIPGKCHFVNYCKHLRQAKIHPIGGHPATCPNPNICEKEMEKFKPGVRSNKNWKIIPVNEVGYYPVKVSTTCQFQPHCGRVPVKKTSVEMWASRKHNVPVRCNFVNYCDALRRYNFHPIGTNPGVCPDPVICGREVQSFVRRREFKAPAQLVPGTGLLVCVDSDVCDDPMRKSRPIPSYIAFKPGPDPDLLPSSCGDLKHCGRAPSRASRPPSTVKKKEDPQICRGKVHCEG